MISSVLLGFMADGDHLLALGHPTDALSWHDTHVSGPFLLSTAANAEGLLLGDYQGLGVSGNEFLPVFVAVTGDLANRTDVFVVPIT